VGASSFVIRLWLPDRPGTLGRVAAAIGRAGGDVIGIEILERGAGMAIDELTVLVDESDSGSRIDAVIAELSTVDGVAVEDVHAVEPDRPEHGVLALDVVSAMVSVTPTSRRLALLCRGLGDLLEADWIAVVDTDSRAVVVEEGKVPDPAWLIAFLVGINHLPSAAEHTPSDVIWAPLVGTDMVVAAERAGRAFRARERQQVERIGRIAGAVLAQS
jgi:hypothetical protein